MNTATYRSDVMLAESNYKACYARVENLSQMAIEITQQYMDSIKELGMLRLNLERLKKYG